jgi:hypothetical protein
MVKITDSNPLLEPLKPKHKSCDRRIPYPTAKFAVDVPDFLEPAERDELAVLEAKYAAARRENERYAPGKAHAYLDSLRARLDESDLGTDSHQAALAGVENGRIGFAELRRSTSRKMAKASVAAVPLALTILRRAKPIIADMIETVDTDYQSHSCRVRGESSCNEQSPLSAGLRRTLQDIDERIVKFETTLRQQKMFEQGRGAPPHEHVPPVRRLAGVLKWMPEVSTEGGAE